MKQFTWIDVGIARVKRHLVEVASDMRHESKRVLRVGVVDQRAEAADAILAVMNIRGSRRFQPEIGAAAGQARLVGKAIRMTCETDLVVGLIEIAGAE